MKKPAVGARRAIISSIAAAAALAAAGCTGGSSSQNQVPSNQPRVATYRCAGEGELRIVNTGASVTVSEQGVTEISDAADADETTAEARFALVAAPPNQRSRYGADGLALVLEGREALWMKAGKAPLTCNR